MDPDSFRLALLKRDHPDYLKTVEKIKSDPTKNIEDYEQKGL